MKYGEPPPLQTGKLISLIADELNDSFIAFQPKNAQDEFLSLSISQKRMVRAVWRMTLEHPEGVMLRELADKLSLSSSAVSVMVESMVRSGVLERVQSPVDRRKVLIRISDLGWEKIKKYDDFLCQTFSRFFNEIAEEDVRAFIKMLEKFTDFLQNNNQGELEK